MTEAGLVAGSFSFLVNKLAQHAGRGMAEALAPMQIGPRESGVLAALAEFGPSTQHRLGEILLVDRSTMVLCIDRLEELGLAEREVHPTDRRSFLVALTDSGLRSVGEARARLEAFEAQLLSALSAAEQAQLRDLVHRVVAAVLPAELRPGRTP